MLLEQDTFKEQHQRHHHQHHRIIVVAMSIFSRANLLHSSGFTEFIILFQYLENTVHRFSVKERVRYRLNVVFNVIIGCVPFMLVMDLDQTID